MVSLVLMMKKKAIVVLCLSSSWLAKVGATFHTDGRVGLVIDGKKIELLCLSFSLLNKVA